VGSGHCGKEYAAHLPLPLPLESPFLPVRGINLAIFEAFSKCYGSLVVQLGDDRYSLRKKEATGTNPAARDITQNSSLNAGTLIKELCTVITSFSA